MAVSFELESTLPEEEELESLVQETVDGQSSESSLRRRSVPILQSSRLQESLLYLNGKRRIIGLLSTIGLLLLMVTYPRGGATGDHTYDTGRDPPVVSPDDSHGDYQNQDNNHDNENPFPAGPDEVPVATPSPTPAPESVGPPSSKPSSSMDRPGTGPVDSPGWKMSPHRLSEAYLPKGQPMTAEQRQAMLEQWGQWTLVDPKAADRPQDDFYTQFPNRDVPYDQFPANAWQRDVDYLSSFLDAGLELVTRAQEAILGEYGYSKFDKPGVDFDERSKMFYVNMVDFVDDKWESNVTVKEAAGWHDRTGWENLQRRILHAIMTEDSFTYLMGGHSAAAGHGNHFWQSYTLQMGKVIEPVFARLGVFFKAHNVGMGGLGTAHNAMGAKDIYGTDIDILYWDSGMTEKSWPHLDLFLRSNLISGGKVPVIWGSLGGGKIREFARKTGADVGLIGYADTKPGYLGIQEVTALEQGSTMPWASQYLKCSRDVECNAFKYNVRCWISRPDVTPTTQQLGTNPGGQVGWHPGWRHHQLVGRTQAFTLLRAMKQALKRWKETDGLLLPDEAWHVSNLFETVHSKTLAFESPDCLSLPLDDLFCTFPMKAKTEFTPRVHGYESSIRSIMKQGGVVPNPDKNLYDPPDIRLTHIEIPEGSVDALNIIENGVPFTINRARKLHVNRLLNPEAYKFKSQNYITPGKGFHAFSNVGAPDNCDGTWDSFCNRAPSSKCLLLHHNDGRNGILMDGFSGWLVLDIANVEKGLVVVKIETWHPTGENPATEGWACENNDCPPGRGLVSNSKQNLVELSRPSFLRPMAVDRFNVTRMLKASTPVPCKDFRFEFAIDGKITSWTNDEFEAHRITVQRVVNVWTLLNDADYVVDGPKNIELALRITGCGRLVTHSLTHVYWA